MRSRNARGWWISLASIVLCAGTVDGGIIYNGDFELGNSGFTTGYTYSPGDVFDERTYTVDTNPANSHPFAASHGDHTSGFGNMLVVNGSTTADVTVWEQAVEVNPHSQYTFSYALSSWSDYEPATLEVSIDGVSIGSATASTTTGTWTEVSYSWTSGATTSANIRIVDTCLSYGGNDFAIDDISMTTTVPVPGALVLSTVGLGLLRRLRRGKKL
ncbi:MAG: hypothetical protein KBE65_04340 [Phycisphaerae bacterium]|nr:hypothetical protein [Phycisphaerae bacterium]